MLLIINHFFWLPLQQNSTEEFSLLMLSSFAPLIKKHSNKIKLYYDMWMHKSVHNALSFEKCTVM